ncbi:putative gustatory receptor 39b [Anopheles aquasalis]|uniref:putative gustatory receptor 39b n=1 Tax=Anopheles aquasalis TaxID=42839 RepID=UPI00215B568F|nr:putative gustatory receptor 39b [Anopheles aquasalis]
MNLLLPLLPTTRQLLSTVFVIFKWFGFIPFPFDCIAFKLLPASGRWPQFVFPVLQLLFYILLHAIVVLYRHVILNTELQILAMNDILKYGTEMVAIYVILINIILQRNVHRAVWVKLAYLRKVYQRKDLVDRFLRTYLAKFYGYMVYSGFIVVQVFRSVANSPPDIAYWTVILILHAFVRLRHLYHLFFIDVLRLHLRQLTVRLTETAEYAKWLWSCDKRSQQYLLGHQRIIDDLLELKCVYGELWEMNDCINRSFGWSQICNFTGNFVQLSCDFYWCYVAAKGLSFEGCKVVFLTLLPTVGLLGLLLYSAESCLRVGTSLGTLLLDFPSGNDAMVNKIVYRFALQMSQQKIHFTAHGLLDINYKLLKMFVTGIITYVTIFISFSNDLSFQKT